MSTVATPKPAVSTWNIDPAHSVAEFKIKHMMISNVKGHFTAVSGALSLDETDITKSALVQVNADYAEERRGAFSSRGLDDSRRHSQCGV